MIVRAIVTSKDRVRLVNLGQYVSVCSPVIDGHLYITQEAVFTMLLLLPRFETDLEVLDSQGSYVALLGRSPLHEVTLYVVIDH